MVETTVNIIVRKQEIRISAADAPLEQIVAVKMFRLPVSATPTVLAKNVDRMGVEAPVVAVPEELLVQAGSAWGEVEMEVTELNRLPPQAVLVRWSTSASSGKATYLNVKLPLKPVVEEIAELV